MSLLFHSNRKSVRTPSNASSLSLAQLPSASSCLDSLPFQATRMLGELTNTLNTLVTRGQILQVFRTHLIPILLDSSSYMLKTPAGHISTDRSRVVKVFAFLWHIWSPCLVYFDDKWSSFVTKIDVVPQEETKQPSHTTTITESNKQSSTASFNEIVLTEIINRIAVESTYKLQVLLFCCQLYVSLYPMHYILIIPPPSFLR